MPSCSVSCRLYVAFFAVAVLAVAGIFVTGNELARWVAPAAAVLILILGAGVTYSVTRALSAGRAAMLRAAQGEDGARWHQTGSGDLARLAGACNAALEAAAERAFKYKNILDSIPNAIATMDKSHHFIFLNAANAAMMGLKSSDQALGRPCDSWQTAICGTADCAVRRYHEGRGAVEFTQPDGTELRAVVTALRGDDSGAFLHMVYDITEEAKLKKQLVAVEQQSRQDAAVSLGQVVRALNDASGQLSTLITQCSEGGQLASSEIASIASAMEEMHNSVTDVARYAATSSDVARNVGAKAEESLRILQGLVADMDGVRGRARGLHDDMEIMSGQADAINNIMTVISDIADQTNLLALNAAIEAARAGDAGRGFAVVADEVRNLAEKTMNSTTDVGKAIRDIQESTAKNRAEAEATSEQIDHAVSQVHQYGTMLKAIVSDAEQSTSQVDFIATSCKEQSSTSEDISRDLGLVNIKAEEAVTGMDSAARVMQILQAEAENLTRIVASIGSGSNTAALPLTPRALSPLSPRRPA